MMRHHSALTLGQIARQQAIGAQARQERPLDLEHDGQTGVIRITGRGVWTASAANEHFTAVAEKLLQTRARGLPIRVLVDLREAAHQSLDSLDRLRWWTANLYRSGDRIAIVVASSVVKSSFRYVPVGATRELFLSEKAARDWLLAYD